MPAAANRFRERMPPNCPPTDAAPLPAQVVLRLVPGDPASLTQHSVSLAPIGARRANGHLAPCSQRTRDGKCFQGFAVIRSYEI